MNPLRAIFLSLSRMPPAVMLLVIIGMAITVTMMATEKVSQQEAELLARESGASAYVVMSADAIPAHTEIDKTMIVQRRAAGNEIWSDAITSKSNAIGRTTDKMIPAHTQIREADLQ